MKRKSAWLSFAACALMGAHPVKAAASNVLVPSAAKVQEETMDFSSVQMVTFKENNNVGFFDNATGTLYIYDPAVSKCTAVKKLTALGKTIQDIPL